MYSLFTKRIETDTGVIKPPGFDLIRRTYQRQIETIINYYNNRVWAVKSNHLLCRVITTSEIPISYDLDRYLEVAYARSPYVAKHFNFTSEIQYGKIKESVFYGIENNELILYNEDYFNPYQAILDWKTLQPVKVLEHPFSDLGLLLPTGHNHSTDTGLVVMSIDIPLLMVQYRGWLFDRKLRGLNESNSVLGVQHFVHMYVLPNILYSHIKNVIMNRLMKLFYNAPMGEALKRHPFPCINYGDKLDLVLTSVLKHIKNARMLYSTMLKNIPSVFCEDEQEAFILPDFAKTRQIWWALILTRLSTMTFLLDVGGENAIRTNRSLVNKLQIDLRRISIDNTYTGLLSKDALFDLNETINHINTL